MTVLTKIFQQLFGGAGRLFLRNCFNFHPVLLTVLSEQILQHSQQFQNILGDS